MFDKNLTVEQNIAVAAVMLGLVAAALLGMRWVILEHYPTAGASLLPRAVAARSYDSADDFLDNQAEVRCAGFIEAGRLEEAHDFCMMAARQGSAAAVNNLGWLALNGEEWMLSAARSVEFFEAAAWGGAHEGAYNAGLAYESSKGVEGNGVEALIWHLVAVELGSKRAVERVRRRLETQKAQRYEWKARKEAKRRLGIIRGRLW